MLVAKEEFIYLKYGITLNTIEEETDSYKAGTIIKQSRPEGYTIISGASLTITISKEVTKVSDETDPLCNAGLC